MPWRARDFVQHQLRRRAGRPQLKRDPLGGRILRPLMMGPWIGLARPARLCGDSLTRGQGAIDFRFVSKSNSHLLIAGTVTVLALVAGCLPPPCGWRCDDPKDQPIEIAPAAVSVPMGDSTLVRAYGAPRGVHWESADNQIATVQAADFATADYNVAWVKGRDVGSITIRAKSRGRHGYAQITVTYRLVPR